MKEFGYFVSWTVVVIGGFIFRAYALAVLWQWFIVTTFNAKPLRMVEALGILCILAHLKQYRRAAKDERSSAEKLLEGVFVAFLSPVISLVIGYFIRANL